MTLSPVRDDLPAVFTPATRNDTDSWVNVVADVVRLATQITGTDFVPRGIRNSIPATAAAMLYGREVGLPPMTALSQIHVVEGRPGMSAEAMRALVLAAGHEIAFDETTGATCRIRGRRSGSATWTEVTWSVDMARAAGLLGKDNWRKYPRSMLIARATADLCRMIFPDVLHGFRTTEELADLDDVDAPTPSHPSASSSTTKTVRRRTPKARPTPIADEPEVTTADLPPLPGEDDAGSGGGQGQTVPSPDPVAEAATVPVAPPLGEGEVDDTPPEDRRAGRPQLRMMFAQFRRLGIEENPGDREERLALVSAIVGHEVTTTNDLTTDEAQAVIVTVSSVRDADALRALLARIESGEAERPMFTVEDPPRVDPPPPSESEHPGIGDTGQDP